jgi:hypothetical protein
VTSLMQLLVAVGIVTTVYAFVCWLLTREK